MDPVIGIDCETTVLSPDYGDRATEITAVLIRGGRIFGQYQIFMSSGRHIPLPHRQLRKVNRFAFLTIHCGWR